MTMHIHHHPDIRKKNIKEYIFEGLMIFMAITLGFFAERLREEWTEHSKGKQLIVSMIEDAQTDMANITKAIDLNKKRVLKLDTLANRCFNYGTPGNDDASLYRLIIACIQHPDFVSPVERTMSQLKNAGGMRLIEKTAATDNIIFYDDIFKKVVNQQDYYDLHLKELLVVTEQVFNMRYFPFNPQTFRWESDPAVLSSAKLITQDKTKIIEFGNKAKIFQGIVMFYIRRLEEAKKHADCLIETLKKEYDIR